MTCALQETILSVGTLPQLGFTGEMLMVAPASEGIDLFKIVGRSISEWILIFTAIRRLDKSFL